MHGTTLHLFVILFPVQYMEKRLKESANRHKKQPSIIHSNAHRGQGRKEERKQIKRKERGVGASTWKGET